jgi:hypothetical protein
VLRWGRATGDPCPQLTLECTGGWARQVKLRPGSRCAHGVLCSDTCLHLDPSWVVVTHSVVSVLAAQVSNRDGSVSSSKALLNVRRLGRMQRAAAMSRGGSPEPNTVRAGAYMTGAGWPRW